MRKLHRLASLFLVMLVASAVIGCGEAPPPPTQAPANKPTRGMTMPQPDGTKPAEAAPAAAS